MRSPSNLFSATSCCAFCHEQFPTHCLQRVDAWQSTFRAVLDTNNKGSIALTKPARLPDINDDIDVALASSQYDTVTISRDPQVVQKHQRYLALCFHDWCYHVLIWKLRGCSYPTIYKLARALIPDSTIWENIRERRHDLDSESRLQMLAGYKLQPLLMSRLPVELRSYIWRHIGLSTPYSAFMLATEACRLARHLRLTSSCDMRLDRRSDLSVKMISVFGTEYIQQLALDKYVEDNLLHLGHEMGLRYITSLGGICAIQLDTIDGKSDWIGKIPNGHCTWHGIIRGLVPSLQYRYNDLNCAAISFPERFSRTQIVWDRPDFPSSLLDPDTALFDLHRDISRPAIDASKRRFFRYLPLYSENEYTQGISIYISGCGIVGLETHFTRTSQLSGYRSGCALHFPLCPRERIAYAWLRFVNSPSSAFGGPALVIQTTLGRIHTFGSYILPHLVVTHRYKWILLRQEGFVSGFYYENVDSGTTISRLGVISDSPTARAASFLPRYHSCDFPSPSIGSPNAGLFLSVAALSGLDKVEVCRIDKRCTGMLMHYINGLILVLGQWHASCISHYYCIHDSNGPSITHIYFKLSEVGSHQIVTDISFSLDTVQTIPSSNYQVFSVEEHIVWWFSERYDKILRWTGDFPYIPKESAIEQNL